MRFVLNVSVALLLNERKFLYNRPLEGHEWSAGTGTHFAYSAP